MLLFGGFGGVFLGMHFQSFTMLVQAADIFLNEMCRQLARRSLFCSSASSKEGAPCCRMIGGGVKRGNPFCGSAVAKKVHHFVVWGGDGKGA